MLFDYEGGASPTPDGESTMTTTRWSAEEIAALIRRSDTAACRAIAALWSYQAPDERKAGITLVKNGVGFNCAHAPAAAELARWICSPNPRQPSNYDLGFKRRTGGWMTFNGVERCRVEVARHIALHYTKQLASIANGEAPETPVYPDRDNDRRWCEGESDIQCEELASRRIAFSSSPSREHPNNRLHQNYWG